MKILIRVDSSNIIGTGHIMRCLNYCEYYPDNSFTFVCRSFSTALISRVKDASHSVVELPYTLEPVLDEYRTWVGEDYNKEIKQLTNIINNNTYNEIIVDHYGIDYKWEKEMRKYCNKLTVITDVYNYTHYCDVFINYTCNNLDRAKSVNLNPNTEYRLGKENVIINKKIREAPKYNKSVVSPIKNIVLTLGGTDPENYTLQIIKKIHDYIKKVNGVITVIIGKLNRHKDSINNFIANDNSHYKIIGDLSYDELIALYLQTDLCIGSLSVMAYEREILGVPQVCVRIAKNQYDITDTDFKVVDIEELSF